MLDFQAARWLMNGEVPKQAGNNHPTSIPTGVFKTRDGYMNIAVSGQQDLGALLQGDRRARAGRRIPTTRTAALRSKNRDALHAEIEAQLAARDTADWVDAAERGRRPVRADLFDRPGVRRPAGAATSASSQKLERRRRYLGQPVTLQPHAERTSSRIRRRRASTPTRSCASSATATPRSSELHERERNRLRSTAMPSRQDDLAQGRTASAG